MAKDIEGHYYTFHNTIEAYWQLTANAHPLMQQAMDMAIIYLMGRVYQMI